MTPHEADNPDEADELHEPETIRIVRAELSRLIEPGDLLAGVMLDVLGPESLHALITSGRAVSRSERDRFVEIAESSGLGPKQQDLNAGLTRWRTRSGQLHGCQDIASMQRLGGGLLIPEDSGWPEQLNDLGPQAPVALWYRAGAPGRTESGPSALDRLPSLSRSVAMVGSREITDYGIRVTAELTQELVRAGLCVISGGAYGVDAAVHRAALRAAEMNEVHRAHGPTLAVLAGGLDRYYPAGNERLLQDVAKEGLLLSEMAPGSAPTRHRFLQRNRLIAALAMVTVVTEARWRSGAQSTAHHALALGRPVGVVPGSIYSASSSGCHRLLKETPAELVTDAAEILALAGGLTLDILASPPSRTRETAKQPVLPVPYPAPNPVDGLTQAQRLLFDALPKRGLSSPGKLSSVAGLPIPTVLAELTRLQRIGRARMVNGQWGQA